tara:strand:+ start:2219 stop:2680 length:462 start_codon:yes stop_codon:yes gene_type:complete
MGRNDWQTPKTFFDKCEKAYGTFDLDVAADAKNTKCKDYFTEEQNALSLNWHTHKNIWCNPPYTNLISWVKKALTESTQGCQVVMLLPYGRWAKWHELILHKAEVVRVIGRIQFELDGVSSGNAPACNILAVIRPPIDGFTYPYGFTGAEIEA